MEQATCAHDASARGLLFCRTEPSASFSLSYGAIILPAGSLYSQQPTTPKTSICNPHTTVTQDLRERTEAKFSLSFHCPQNHRSHPWFEAMTASFSGSSDRHWRLVFLFRLLFPCYFLPLSTDLPILRGVQFSPPRLQGAPLRRDTNSSEMLATSIDCWPIIRGANIKSE